MKGQFLVRKCQKNGIELTIAGSDLRLVADEALLTDELIELVRSNKKSIVDYLDEKTISEDSDTREWGDIDNIVSKNQYALLVLDRLYESSLQYNMPFIVNVNGKLDGDVLESAIRDVIRRHVSLGRVLRIGTGSVSSHVLRDSRFSLERIDLAHRSTDEGFGGLNRLLEQITLKPFDLRKDLPIRVSLIRISHNEYRILIVCHHVAVDRWSSSLIIDDLIESYNDSIRGIERTGYRPGRSYSEYAFEQSIASCFGDYNDSVSYWINKVKKKAMFMTCGWIEPDLLNRASSGSILNIG